LFLFICGTSACSHCREKKRTVPGWRFASPAISCTSRSGTARHKLFHELLFFQRRIAEKSTQQAKKTCARLSQQRSKREGKKAAAVLPPCSHACMNVCKRTLKFILCFTLGKLENKIIGAEQTLHFSCYNKTAQSCALEYACACGGLFGFHAL
jgi:hypothetical protein